MWYQTNQDFVPVQSQCGIKLTRSLCQYRDNVVFNEPGVCAITEAMWYQTNQEVVQV